MRVSSQVLEGLHLDPGYALLSVQNILTLMEYFRLLDVHFHSSINDVQFWILAQTITDLSRPEAEALFHLLDVDHSGEMDFEEFYLLFCIMIACKDKYEKEFIYRHSNSIFKLIDADASGTVDVSEFYQMGVLFNFDKYSITNIFREFDISGDKTLDFQEFRLFTMACIDEKRSDEAHLKVEAFSSYQQRLMVSLRSILINYVKTNCFPAPIKVAKHLTAVGLPHLDKRKRWRKWWDTEYFQYTFDRVVGSVKSGFLKCWKVVSNPFIKLYTKVGRSCKKWGQNTRFSGVAKRRRAKRAKRQILSYKYYNRNIRAGNFKSVVRLGNGKYMESQDEMPMPAVVEVEDKTEADQEGRRRSSAASASVKFVGRNSIKELNTSEMERVNYC